MNRIRTLGISDPHRRVIAWLCGCASVSAVGALVGVLAMLFVAVVLGACVATRLRA